MTLHRPANLAFQAAPWPLADGRPSLICIHGSGSDHSLWEAQLEGLPDRCNVVAVDLPGHGASPGPALEAVAGLARTMNGFLTALAPPQPVVCGLSLGGAVALELLLDGTVRLAGGILVGTGARLRVHPEIFETLERDFEAYVNGLAALGASPATDPRRLAGVAAAARSCGPQVTAMDFRACDRFDVMERVGEIHLPVLVVTGTDDRLTPPKYGDYLARHIPGARRVLIPDAGHLVPLEQPEALNRAMAEFLETLAA